MWSFPEYPENWNEIREAMFVAYGGKYCLKGIFMEFGHKGYIQLHHQVPLSAAKNKSEYYFLNQAWNLVPLCEKHHNDCHQHMNGIKGDYNLKQYKEKKVGYLRRFCWWLKRKHYQYEFKNRKSKENVLFFWNYWKGGEQKLKEEMLEWPSQYLENIV